MIRRTVALTIIATTIFTSSHAQSFSALTSQLFFSIDIPLKDSTPIKQLDSKRELASKPRENWAVYPPTDDNGNVLSFQQYIFFKHPYFSQSFANGTITVLSDNETNNVVGLTIAMSFNSKSDFDAAYKDLGQSYRNCSSRPVRRGGLAWPFESTKYISKENKDFVIISKGEVEHLYYLTLAYNYEEKQKVQ